MTVMVVEDDADIRESLCAIISDEGHAVLPAANGREALNILNDRSKPAVILLDMMMPVMDGRAFCLALAQQPNYSDIPIIIISAHADVGAVAESLNVAGCLKKPLNLSALLDVLDKYAAH